MIVFAAIGVAALIGFGLAWLVLNQPAAAGWGALALLAYGLGFWSQK